jgi:hypothetical protein
MFLECALTLSLTVRRHADERSIWASGTRLIG